MTILDRYSEAIRKLCTQHRVKRLYAFGSVLTNEFDTNSDIDLIVDFDTIDIASYVDNYYDLKFSLQDILNKPVDLLEEQAIKNPYFKEAIHQNRKFVYGH